MQLFAGSPFPHQLLYDTRYLLPRQCVHLIPEVLAGEISGGEMDQLGEIGGLGPITKSPLTARRTGAGDHRHKQRLANRQAVADLRIPLCINGAVDAPRDIEFLGQAKQRRNRTGRYRGDLHWRLLVLLVALKNIVDPAQMGQYTNRRLAIFPKRFDDAVITNAVRLIGLQGSHMLRIYTIAIYPSQLL